MLIFVAKVLSSSEKIALQSFLKNPEEGQLQKRAKTMADRLDNSDDEDSIYKWSKYFWSLWRCDMDTSNFCRMWKILQYGGDLSLPIDENQWSQQLLNDTIFEVSSKNANAISCYFSIDRYHGLILRFFNISHMK